MSGTRAPVTVRPVALIAWALAALLAGAIVWWAVAVIGSERGAARDGVYTASQVEGLLADQLSSSANLPTTASTGSASASPTAGSPLAPAPVEPAPTDGSGAVVPPAAASGDQAAEPVARTWDVEGGQVGAACKATEISLLYATPQDGWTLELKHAGPAEIEVNFRRGEAESSLHAACVNGVPEIQAEDSHGSGRGSGGGGSDD